MGWSRGMGRSSTLGNGRPRRPCRPPRDGDRPRSRWDARSHRSQGERAHPSRHPDRRQPGPLRSDPVRGAPSRRRRVVPSCAHPGCAHGPAPRSFADRSVSRAGSGEARRRSFAAGRRGAIPHRPGPPRQPAARLHQGGGVPRLPATGRGAVVAPLGGPSPHRAGAAQGAGGEPRAPRGTASRPFAHRPRPRARPPSAVAGVGAGAGHGPARQRTPGAGGPPGRGVGRRRGTPPGGPIRRRGRRRASPRSLHLAQGHPARHGPPSRRLSRVVCPPAAARSRPHPWGLAPTAPRIRRRLARMPDAHIRRPLPAYPWDGRDGRAARRTPQGGHSLVRGSAGAPGGRPRRPPCAAVGAQAGEDGR